MSKLNGKIADRRSTRSLYSQNLDAASGEIQEIKNLDSVPPESEKSSEECSIASQHEENAEVSETFKITDGGEDNKQIENIPDNTQVVSPKTDQGSKDPSSKFQMGKKDYKKKQMKTGITDREWLSSVDHREKWTALDAKRGMCNDCKKVFSSRQALRYHCEASRDCFRMGKFCREDHDHQLVSKEFGSLDEIMDWLHSEELDTQFSCKGGYSSFEAAAKHRRMPNKIYWCNRNPRTKSYVPKRGEKSSSRKLPAGQRCPAIIQIRAHEVFLNTKDGSNDDQKAEKAFLLHKSEKPQGEKKVSSHLPTKIVWRVKGCLTHSHDTDDTGKSLRLSKRVRKNIGLLLKLDLPMQVIRSKYLKMDNFGGSSGKVPSIESSRQIQLGTYPAPPDLSCPEMEIVFRYMRYNLSVRAFNFIRPGVPTSANPTSGIRQSSKDPDSSCGLMERDTLARAVQANDVIVVFMDEDQRKIFRESSGAIIVSSVDHIFTNPGYSFFSVCVMDSRGEAMPVCQAISANDYESTAKIMLETMKLLEPSTVCGIHCLMASEALENPFIQALSQTLPPNSELSTYPLHQLCIETYDYIVQSSLKPVVTRLDQFIYSIFKMNEFLQCRRERYACGFHGKTKSKIRKSFEFLHETFEQKESIRFEIVEAITQDLRNNDSNIDTTTNLHNENQAWEISKFDGEILIEGESHVISAIPKGKTFCFDKTCQVICDKCIKESFGNSIVVDDILSTDNLPCSHALSCSCAEYNTTYNCMHLHIITRHIMNDKRSQGDNESRKLVDQSDVFVSKKSDHNYVHEHKLGDASSEQIDATSIDEGDESKSIRPCTVKLQKLEDIDLNKALSTPFLKRNDSKFGEDELLTEAISKLTAAAKYLRKLKEKNVGISSSKNDTNNAQRKSSRKRKRPVVKNVCMDVIDFIDSSFPDNVKDAMEKHVKAVEDETSGKYDIDLKLCKSKELNYTKSTGCTLRNHKMENMNAEKQDIIWKTKIHPNQILGADVPRHNLLRVALNASVSDFSWCTLLCGHQEKNLEMFANLQDFDINEREIILEKFILAKSLWTCKKCKDFSSIDSMLSGFIICKLCQHWFHRNCCASESQSLQLTDDFVCERCMSLFLGHVSEEPMEGDENIPTQETLQLHTVTVEAPTGINDVTNKNFVVENIEASSKLNQGEQQIEFIQAQPSLETQELSAEDQLATGPQIYYQLPPNVSFPPTGEGHYVVQLQGNTVQQIGFEVL